MDVPRPGLPAELGEVTVRAILESAPDALVIVDGKGTIVLVNSQAERLFGYGREELVGQKIELLVPQDLRGVHVGHRDRFMADPKARPMGAALDLRARRKDGSEIPVEISLSPLGTTKGRFVSAAIRDVTGRRKAEQKFRALLESAPDAIVIVDARGHIVLTNAQAERLFGYTRAELLAANVDQLVPDSVRAGHGEHRARFMADAKTRSMGAALDLNARRKDGSEIPVEISLSPLDTEEGPLVSAAIRDVTNRRKAEQKFRALLEGAPDAIVIVDDHGTIVLANAQAERLFGYPRAELIGSSVERLVPDAVRGVHPGHRQRFMADPKARPMGAALDLRARRKDGSEIPVEISLSPLETEGERLVMAAVRDITDRRRMEQERQLDRDRQRELDHLRQVDQFKTTFLNTAAHELRTPLLPIKSQFHLLKRKLLEAPDAQTATGVAILDRNIVRLASLVEDLLDAARYQAGRVALQPEEGDLHVVVDEAVASFRQLATDRSIDLRLTKDGSGRFRFDARRVTQVLYNLLGNAVKFTGDGGRIDVECRIGPGEARVRVTDSGLGLSASDLGKLFQPFAQLQESVVPGQRGSGLGLYISRGFVEAHGGRIWAESPGHGQGATFSFTLPVPGPAAQSPAVP
jgi:PAS domain S-box-containing protein